MSLERQLEVGCQRCGGRGVTVVRRALPAVVCTCAAGRLVAPSTILAAEDWIRTSVLPGMSRTR